MNKTGIKQLLCGKLLFLAIAFSLSACRTDKPPAIDICIGDGAGGADCVLKDGTQVWRSPSELKNYWITTQADMANYSAWCYKTTVSNVTHEMNKLEARARGL